MLLMASMTAVLKSCKCPGDKESQRCASLSANEYFRRTFYLVVTIKPETLHLSIECTQNLQDFKVGLLHLVAHSL